MRAPRGGEYAANLALRFLFDGGWVDRIPLYLPDPRNYRDGRDGLVNVLTPKGAKALQEHYDEAGEGHVVRWRPNRNPPPWREQFHAGAIANVGVAAMKSCQEDPWHLWGWEDDRYLSTRQRMGLTHFATIPDAFFIVTNHTTTRDYTYFMELDLGSAAQISKRERTTWAGKVTGYGHYLGKNGAYIQDYPEHPKPVILCPTRGEKRRDNLRATTAQLGGKGAFWFATLADLHQRGFFADIWYVPHEDQPRSLAHRR